MNNIFYKSAKVLVCVALLATPAYAQMKKEEPTPVLLSDTLRTLNMPQIEIIGEKAGLFTDVPGSLALIRPRDIKNLAPITGNELLRKVPGLNIVDEEGAGLRINIGIRGLDPDRSRNVLMLEDGIPVALNPYGEPEMYFTPTIDKMSRIEVLKGSGQILFGPQTIGGVVNLITADPTATPETTFRLRAGQGGFLSTYLGHGNTVGKAGYYVSVLHKRADQIGNTWFNLTDISAKFKYQVSEKSRFGVKLNLYDEFSNSTYIGLTQTMYDQGGQDFVQMAPGDRLPVRRYAASVTHEYDFQPHIRLQTTAFAYTTTRNWVRQDFSASATAANRTGVVWGNPAIPGGAIYMQRTSGNRNRQFEVAGIEPRLTVEHGLFGQQNTLQTGVRLLYERAFEQFVIGNKPDALAGTIRDNEVRTGYAFSAYAQHQTLLGERWNASLGVRMENFDYERNIMRGRFGGVVRDTSVIASSNTFALIPGAGINYTASEQITLFAGVHKGFAPPRTKDAITAEGMPLDIEAEISTNYELGLRAQAGKFLALEATAFYMDFVNQIIPVSQSSGNQNATGLVNGGRTRHQGIEAGAVADLAKVLNSRHSFTLEASATYVYSEYSADRFVGTEGTNIKGNKLPYAPELILWASAGAELSNGIGARLTWNYTGEHFSDELNSVQAAANGRTGLIDARHLIDANVFYNIKKWNASFNVAVKNLTNERYIASRRPQGIRVGLPRFITVGFEITF
jgi:Fe(3+) dicitrate transport protein